MYAKILPLVFFKILYLPYQWLNIMSSFRFHRVVKPEEKLIHNLLTISILSVPHGHQPASPQMLLYTTGS